jgi:hypothetical protein
MRFNDLQDAPILLRLLAAVCISYLTWSGFARERWTIRPRRWFLNRYPEDNYIFPAGTEPSAKYARIETFRATTDLRTAPIGIRRYQTFTDQIMEVTDAGFVAAALPSDPHLFLDPATGEWQLIYNGSTVEGLIVTEPTGKRLLNPNEPSPTRYVQRNDTGLWQVGPEAGRWAANLLMCHKCFGFWLATAITPAIVLLTSPWIMLTGYAAIVACGIRYAHHYIA